MQRILSQHEEDTLFLLKREECPSAFVKFLRLSDAFEKKLDGEKYEFLGDWNNYCEQIILTRFFGIDINGEIKYVPAALRPSVEGRAPSSSFHTILELKELFGYAGREMGSFILLSTHNEEGAELDQWLLISRFIYSLANLIFMQKSMGNTITAKDSFFSYAYCAEAFRAFSCRVDSRLFVQNLLRFNVLQFYFLMQKAFLELSEDEKKLFYWQGRDPLQYTVDCYDRGKIEPFRDILLERGYVVEVGSNLLFCPDIVHIKNPDDVPGEASVFEKKNVFQIVQRYMAHVMRSRTIVNLVT